MIVGPLIKYYGLSLEEASNLSQRQAIYLAKAMAEEAKIQEEAVKRASGKQPISKGKLAHTAALARNL